MFEISNDLTPPKKCIIKKLPYINTPIRFYDSRMEIGMS